MVPKLQFFPYTFAFVFSIDSFINLVAFLMIQKSWKQLLWSFLSSLILWIVMRLKLSSLFENIRHDVDFHRYPLAFSYAFFCFYHLNSFGMAKFK